MRHSQVPISRKDAKPQSIAKKTGSSLSEITRFDLDCNVVLTTHIIK
jgi:hypothetical protein